MWRRLKTNNHLLIILALTLLFSGCTTIYNPATQRREIRLIDTENEVAIGNKMDSQVNKKIEIIHDPQRQQRLNRIASGVAAVSDRQDLVYHFRIAKNNEFNAFAIPGGFIYVNSGLMDNATDDELACVLGHEIGHVAARHSIKKLEANLGYQVVMNIALGISGQQTMGQAMDIVYNLINLGYSRKDELLADKLAVRYAKRSGFNPHAMVTFFEKLKNEAGSKPSHYNPVFLSSHPAIDDRIKNVENEITLPEN